MSTKDDTSPDKGGVEELLPLDILEEPRVSSPDPNSLVEGAIAQAPEQPTEPSFYSDDEFSNIPVEQLDESRLAPTQKAYYKMMKNLESGYQRKFQQLAEERRQYQQPNQYQPQMSDEDRLFMEYVNNPDVVVTRINQAMHKAQMEDPDRVVEYQNVKDKLQLRYFNSTMQGLVSQTAQQAAVSATFGKIKEYVPEYTPEVAQELERFAIQELGYTPQDLQAMTSFQYPELAAKNVRNIHQIWKQKQSATKVKSRPTRVESAGTGFDRKPETKWTEEDSFEAIRKGRAR